MSAPRLLDLFCGAGGAAMGYSRAGFQVVGVDVAPQPHYPFEFQLGDALSVPHFWALSDFDAIHASPPCQAFTAYRRKGHGVGDGYPDLIAPTRELLEDSGVPWVMENVQGAPLAPTITLCGSMFGLDVRRHRLFESNLMLLQPECRHDLQRGSFPHATNRTNPRKTVEVGVWRIPLSVQQAAMGIDWMTLSELTEAVPPAYTEHIGVQLLAALEVAR